MQPPTHLRTRLTPQAKAPQRKQPNQIHHITRPLSDTAHHCTRNHKHTGKLTHTKPIHY